MSARLVDNSIEILKASRDWVRVIRRQERDNFATKWGDPTVPQKQIYIANDGFRSLRLDSKVSTTPRKDKTDDTISGSHARVITGVDAQGQSVIMMAARRLKSGVPIWAD
jgi:hypothetical protein